MVAWPLNANGIPSKGLRDLSAGAMVIGDPLAIG